MVSFRDITERKRVEEDLRLAASAFESHEAITITDPDGVILRVNEAFTSITGYTAGEIVGKHSRVLSSGQQGKAFYRKMWQVLLEQGVWEGEIVSRRKDGEAYPEWLGITAVKNEAGETTHYVGHFQDITERKRAASKIERQAYYDALTDLPNRRFIYDQLQKALSRCKRHGHTGALLFLDVDHFKVINDSLGHQVGDGLVKQVAERLAGEVRAEDTAARLGGDEFVVLMTELAEDPEMALMETQIVVQKIQSAIARPFHIDGNELHVSISIGITLFPENSDVADDVLKQADIAMYKAKEQGRDTFQFYLPSMQLAASERLQMENDLRKAIHNGELSLHYQPQFSIDNQLMGAECLLRWLRPEEGMISPARFIPVAEDSGLILSIGEWVMRSACKQLRMWELEGRGAEINRLAINVSPKQFKQHDFVVMVSRIIEESGIDPSRVELELTEGMLLENVEETIDKMTQLKSIGISFAIDDFGTGYSSLSYLKRLPLDKLKIDQSFVRDIEKGDSGSAIVETIISMTHHLGLEVIAEGVETRGQLDFLKHSGCHHFQGYYFNRPLPVDEFEKELNESIIPI